MKLNHQHSRKGFTLVEILIGVSILAMLASGMWVAVASYQNKKLVKKAETEITLHNEVADFGKSLIFPLKRQAAGNH